MKDDDRALIELAERVEREMVRHASAGSNYNPAVSGQAASMQRAANCAAVLTALRATIEARKP